MAFTIWMCEPQTVALDALPQLQLVPSASGPNSGGSLPSSGRIGDFFLGVNVDGRAQLFICTYILGTTPE